MGVSIPDPQYVTLSTAGVGTVRFRGQIPTVVKIIEKITIESPSTGSGTVSIYFRDTLISSKAIARLMTAEGQMRLHAGEEVRVEFANGPPSVRILVTAHYEEVPL